MRRLGRALDDWCCDKYKNLVLADLNISFERRHEILQQFDILTCADPDKPLQPPFMH